MREYTDIDYLSPEENQAVRKFRYYDITGVVVGQTKDEALETAQLMLTLDRGIDVDRDDIEIEYEPQCSDTD